MLNTFSCTCWLFICLLWKKCLFKSSAHFLNQIFKTELYAFLIHFGYEPLIRLYGLQIFCPILWVIISFCFFCCTEAFYFDEVPCVDFCFWCLYFWYQSQVSVKACSHGIGGAHRELAIGWEVWVRHVVHWGFSWSS